MFDLHFILSVGFGDDVSHRRHRSSQGVARCRSCASRAPVTHEEAQDVRGLIAAVETEILAPDPR